MNKKLIIGLALLVLCIASVYAISVKVSNADNKIVAFGTEDKMWNLGFRTADETNFCKNYPNSLTTDALMECYGFKAKS